MSRYSTTNPILQIQGLQHRGVRQLANRGERMLDSDLVRTSIACRFHDLLRATTSMPELWVRISMNHHNS